MTGEGGCCPADANTAANVLHFLLMRSSSRRATPPTATSVALFFPLFSVF